METIDIQIFKTAKHQADPFKIGLIEFLTTDRWKEKIEKLRVANDKEEISRIKLTLPCAMPSLKVDGSHSGYIVIDVDGKDNIGYLPIQLKEKMCSIANVFYCGYSCSGRGVFALIPLHDTTKHLQHFEALEVVFAMIGINIDAGCSNVNRLRFCSYDSEPYFNYDAVPFRKIVAPEVPKIKFTSPNFVRVDNIFKDYNDKADMIGLLTNHGWRVTKEKGDRIFLTRPDKKQGVSGEYSDSKRLFYCYSSAAQFEANKAYSAVDLLNTLEFNGDIKRTAKEIKKLIK